MNKQNKQQNSGSEKKGSLSPFTVAMLILAFSLLVGTLAVGTVAKYIRQRQGTSVVKASEFYFTSDYLKAGGFDYYINHINTEKNTLTFVLRNYEGDNVSEFDIDFTMTLNDATVDTTTTDAQTVGGVKVQLDKTFLEKNDKETVTVTLSDVTPGQSYTVVVTSTSGYTKTLSATFHVEALPTGIYKYTAITADYVLLTVWTENASCNYSFTIPAGLTPDHTDELLMEHLSDGVVSNSLNTYSSHHYRMFITGDYNGDPIAVSDIKNETPIS